jgi:hypothetical protein
MREPHLELIQILYEKRLLKHICLNRLFILAILSKSAQLLEYFLKEGVNVNHCDKDGNSALILTIKNIEFEHFQRIVEYLVDHGADVNHLNNKGQSALYYACNSSIGDCYEMSEYLIQKGAHLSIKNKKGESLFSRVCHRSYYGWRCKYLLCSDLIRNFYNLFQSQDYSVLPNKVTKSIDNNDLQFIDYLDAFKLIHAEEDKVVNSRKLRDEQILEYFTSFDFSEKFVTDILISLKDKLELLYTGKNKIEVHFPQIKKPIMEKFDLEVNKEKELVFTTPIDLFMEKFRKHKELIKLKYGCTDEPNQFVERSLNFLELEDMLGDNLLNIINDESNECAKLKKAYLLCEKIDSMIDKVETFSDIAHKLFDFLSQEEVRCFLNLNI